MDCLLAVDLGIKTGLALYERDGTLSWYRSQNFGKAARLRRGVSSLLRSIPDLVLVVLEGGGTLAKIWEREAEYRKIAVRTVSAEQWRQQLLYQREQRSGAQAKRTADELARRIIIWSGVPRPTSLRHDAAEAVLIGLWALLDIGWLEQLPADLRK